MFSALHRVFTPIAEPFGKFFSTSIYLLSIGLRPVTFKWKKEKDIPSDHRAYVEGSENRVMLSNGETNHGFIAQEVKTALDNHPEVKDGLRLWAEDERDGRQRVASAELIPLLTKAIQELSAKNDALEARIATLEG